MGSHHNPLRFVYLGLGLTLTLGLNGFKPSLALAQTIQCKGNLGAIAIGNLEVPSGATCTLRQTVVKGNITVQPMGTLITHGAVIEGNIRASQALGLTLNNTRVQGTIERPSQSRSPN
ncbi:hypothetical protein NIES970_15800 [[Synechococcus] sp. NIES-970]|nr:hypothetical protein NIES970_15800 [[Synechococcus] sp. NIES-970]